MSDLPQRRSIRLKGYDYSESGVYFITICAWQMKTLFAKVRDGQILLNALGQAVVEEWLRTPCIRPGVELDAFVVMPNHLHAVLIVNSGRRGVQPYARTSDTSPLRPPSRTLGALIRGFKSASTKRINEIRGTFGQPIWQRNYYEHIVRNGKDLDEIRHYIRTNPLRWGLDRNNPDFASRKTGRTGVLLHAPTTVSTTQKKPGS